MGEHARPDQIELVGYSVLEGDHILADLRHRIRAGGTKRRGFGNRNLVGQNLAVHFGGRTDVNPRVDPDDSYRVHQVDGTDDIAVERVGRRGEAHVDIRLRGQVMNAVGPHLAQQQDQRVQIAQVALMKLDSGQDLLNVAKRAAPAHETVDFRLGEG